MLVGAPKGGNLAGLVPAPDRRCPGEMCQEVAADTLAGDHQELLTGGTL